MSKANVTPYMLSWNYVFNIGKMAHLRIGPSLGLITITGKNTYEPSYPDGLPGAFRKSESSLAYGFNVSLA